MTLIDTMKNRLALRARYSRTRHELTALPFEQKVDLGINGREEAVARAAVYG
ncbi:hypothetical protein FIU97_09975 [Roseivivax sp. THAF40]|uniref:hypothetical protein n=1 Tax=unclassified Roseivivax TaxID=2639302 RepID=UPI0012AA727A|nr:MULTISPECIES: hypothetical protein [unclassified Roseivivax]QFS83154.1 hypothetical protein FIV09_09990 [Roseivivax sp. THAF197b]QFT46898.1 hypothetical protein FIU97_09975 [Roseivivax sp. THAF40]